MSFTLAPERVLNPSLYQALLELSPTNSVTVTKHGLAATVVHRPDWKHRGGRLRAEVVEWGETYSLDCPFCGDTRKRLAICHLWNVRDDATGDDMLHLAMCFNEGCLATREQQKLLSYMVYPMPCEVRERKPKNLDVRVTIPDVRALEMPVAVPVHELWLTHPAQGYLRVRGFDPCAVSKRWGIRHCEGNSTVPPRFSDDRILVPVMAPASALSRRPEIILAGWQARAINHDGRRGGQPKYLSCAGMKKNQLLYGLPEAMKTQGPIVVVEGVTDAWRLDTNVVAIFGKTISAIQSHLVACRFRGRPVVVLLDADAGEEAEMVADKIRISRGMEHDRSPVMVGHIPGQRKDPGECTSTEVWLAIRAVLSGWGIGFTPPCTGS